MPEPLGPVTIDAAGEFSIALPQGIQHGDYKGVILWNTSGYIISIVPNFNEAGSFTMPPSNGIALNNDWDYTIPLTVTIPTGSTPISGVIAGSIYFNNETVPPPPNINPTTVAAVVESGTITVSGTVDVSSGTIDIGNSPSVNVTSGTIDIGNTPSVTVGSGTIDIGNTPSVTISSGSVDVTSGTVDIGNTPTVNISAGQVVDVQNAAGASLTVAGTVDAAVTGNVTIDAGTVNIQPVESASLGSLFGSGTLTLTPSKNAVAFHILAPGSSAIQVQGITTDTLYPVIPSSSLLQNNNTLWACPIDTGLDAIYTVNVQTPAITWYVSEVYAGITELASVAIDGGANSIIISNTGVAASVYGLPVIALQSTIYIYSYGGPENPPIITTDLAGSGIKPGFPVRLLNIDTLGGTLWEALIPPNISSQNELLITFTTAVEAIISTSSRPSGWPTYKGTYQVVVSNPAPGTNWSYALPVNAKLVAATGSFVTSSVSATRYPGINYQSISGFVNLFSTSAAITASTTLYWYAFKGVPQGLASPAYADNVTYTQLPDLALPKGAILSGGVPGLESGDQWSGVVLVFEPV